MDKKAKQSSGVPPNSKQASQSNWKRAGFVCFFWSLSISPCLLCGYFESALSDFKQRLTKSRMKVLLVISDWNLHHHGAAWRQASKWFAVSLYHIRLYLLTHVYWAFSYPYVILISLARFIPEEKKYTTGVFLGVFVCLVGLFFFFNIWDPLWKCEIVIQKWAVIQWSHLNPLNSQTYLTYSHTFPISFTVDTQ